MRIVLDTNIYVSALINPHGPPAALLDLWFDDRIDVVTSDEQLVELYDVLSRPRLQKYLHGETADQLCKRLVIVSLPAAQLPNVDLSPDSDDNVILATAIAGLAAMLVTGDKKHLLPLGNVQGIPIVEPIEALRRLSES